MAFIKVPSHIKTSILAFVKHLVSKSVYNDIKSLLEPCCKPTLRIYNNYTCTGDSYTIFNAVSVVSEQNKNKRVTLLFTFTNTGTPVHTTATVEGTLGNSGEWSSAVTLLTWIVGGTTDVTVAVIPEGSNIIVHSDKITLTGVTSCD